MCDSPIETELYYLQSRYYDPEICRFINADGYASTGQGLLGGNAFAYCGNNPTIRVDILGYEWKVVGAGIQLTISGSIGGTSVEIGFEVIIYWDTDEVSDAGHAVVAVYLYGGSSFDAPNILNDVLGLTGLLMDSVENLTKNTGKELSSVLDTWNPSLSLSVSASAVLILGNEKFTSCLSYEHEFKNCSISIAGIKGSFAFSDCCRAISLGVVKTIGAPQKCVSLGKSYYVCLWSTEKGFLPGVRRYEK